MAGHIEKRGENTWRVTIFLGEEHGKPVRHRKTIHGTKKDAEKYMTGVLRDRDMGRFAEPSRVRVGEYLDTWLREGAKPKVRERTYTDYVDVVEKRIKPRIGSIPLDRLTPLAIQSFYNELSAAGYSSKTVRNTHNVLQSALKQAVRWRMLQHNPAADVELPRREKKEMPALDSSQARRFLDVAKTFPRGIAYVVGLTAGMRPQEYLALRWPDIDLSTGATKVQRTLFRPRGGGWRFEEMKTAGSRRTVVLPKGLLPLLREHRKQQLQHRLLLGPDYQNHDLVFTNEMGGPLEAQNLNKRTFKKILEAAGLPPTLGPYSLRHSCATLLLEAGKNPKIVSERLGHASIVLTMDTYSHVTPTMQQDAADTLDELLFSTPKPGQKNAAE